MCPDAVPYTLNTHQHTDAQAETYTHEEEERDEQEGGCAELGTSSTRDRVRTGTWWYAFSNAYGPYEMDRRGRPIKALGRGLGVFLFIQYRLRVKVPTSSFPQGQS